MAATKVISKQLLKNPRTKYKLDNQIKLHKTLHHENVVEFIHSFEDEENVYIFLELCPNECLNDYLLRRTRFTVAESQNFLIELVHGVSYLHSRGILHRDLKLGNLFLGPNNEIKIGDFGLACRFQFEDERKRSLCGTPNYIAPEILQGQGYCYEVDIWSIGVILYTLLVGIPPFETEEVKTTYQRIKSNEYEFPSLNPPIPEEAKWLIKSILNPNPALRPTLSQILQSPFFQLGKANSALQQLSITSNNGRAMESLKRYTSMSNLKELKKVEDRNRPIKICQFMESAEGMGFCLNNGVQGYMNDSKTILFNKETNEYCLITRHKQKKDIVQKVNDEKLIVRFGEDFQSLRKCLSKVRHFKPDPFEYVANHQKLCYVKKYFKHDDFYSFRLSNQTVQLKFQDQSQTLLSKNGLIRFWQKAKDSELCGTFEEISNMNNNSFSKKAKYIKSILEMLVR